MKLFRKSSEHKRHSRVVDHRAIEAQEQYRLYQQHKQRYQHPQQHQPIPQNHQMYPPHPPHQHQHQPHRQPQQPRRQQQQPHRQEQHRQEQHHRQQRQPPVEPIEDEYEYVRREHGFDYMPPSQYVPSRSMSEETDEITEDAAPVAANKMLDILSSSSYDDDDDDLSHSDNGGHDEVEYSYQPVVVNSRRKQQKTPPVVRGKPVDVKRLARKMEKHARTHQAVPQHYRSHREAAPPPVPQEEMEYRRKHKSSSSKAKVPRSPEEAYLEDDAPILPQSSPRQAPRRPVVRSEKMPKGYDRHQKMRRQSDFGDENDYTEDEPEDVPSVPTAFSYESGDDSMDDPDSAKLSRYEIEARKEVYTTKPHKKKKERHIKVDGRGKRRGELETFTKPAYQRRSRKEQSPVSEVVIEAPLRERRSETHKKSHRRSKSREFREPVERFEEPLGIEQPRDDTLTDYGLEVSMNDYRNQPYYDDRRMAPGYVSDDPMERVHGTAEKRRSKGIFGRIKNGFLGEKSSKRIVENAWGQELREMDDLLGKTQTSFGSDLSPYPRYQVDEPSARVPYPYEDGYYEQGGRMTSKPLPPVPVQPPHPHSHPRRQSPYDQRLPPPDYMYDGGPGRKPAQSSGKPFQTSRTATPILRANPDQRHRYIPMNTSMSKQYRSQHQGMGGAPPRGSQSPSAQARRGIFGCAA
jgi:hypothetical protein